MSKRKTTDDDASVDGDQANATASENQNKSNKSHSLVDEITALLDAYTDADAPESSPSAAQLSTIVANCHHKQVPLIFKAVFDRLISTIRTTEVIAVETAAAARVDKNANHLLLLNKLGAFLVQLKADALTFATCSSNITALLSSARPDHYHQPWFYGTISALIKRLDKSKLRSIVALVRTSFNRLVVALCQVDQGTNTSTIDTLCNASAILERVYVPVSCHDQLDTIINALIKLAAPLLPDYLGSGCLASPLPAAAASSTPSDDITSIQRVACALLHLLSLPDLTSTSSSRHQIYSLVLTAAVHFETLAAASDARQALFTSLGKFVSAKRLVGEMIADFGMLVERLLATCCFRSLIDRSVFLAFLTISLALPGDNGVAVRAFVAKMLEWSHVFRMRRSGGWLDAAMQCKCGTRQPSQSAMSDAELPLARLFASLTSFRLGRLLDTILGPGWSQETAVQCIAVCLMQIGDAELRPLASQLVDYLVTRGENIRISLVLTLVNLACFFPPTATVGGDDTQLSQISMSARRFMCREVTRLLHSGTQCSSSPDARATGSLSFRSAYMVRTLYHVGRKEENSFDMLPAFCERRISIVDHMVALIHTVLLATTSSSSPSTVDQFDHKLE